MHSLKPKNVNRMDVLNKLFDQVGNDLHGDSLNYVVTVALYHAAATSPEPHEIIKTALGQGAVLGGYTQADREQVYNDVIEGFRYEGDDGSHPDLTYLRS